MTQSKYILKCTACGKVYESFAEWFAAGQKCECGCARAEAEYNADYSKLAGLPKDDSFMRKYFDFLPLVERENVVTDGEGCTPIERWSFLEDWARENGTECEVYVTRNDLSKGTGTFKDPAGALAASLFKENGVRSSVSHPQAILPQLTHTILLKQASNTQCSCHLRYLKTQ